MKSVRFAGLTGLILLLALPVVSSSAYAQAAPSQAPIAVPDEVLIGVRAGAAGANVAAANTADLGQVLGGHQALGAYRVKLAPGISIALAASRLRSRSGILYVEPNYIRRKSATPNDSGYSHQWAPAKVQADKAWDIWTPKAQTIVAIVDTGIDLTHPDLKDILVHDSSGNVVGTNIVTPGSSPQDDEGHGSHCAGIAAAHINNGTGIAGIAGWNPNIPGSDTWVKLMPVKVLDSSGSGTDSDVADGIIWAADHGAGVISLSLGGAGYSNTLDNACQYAWNKGCVVVAAAGNDGSSTPSYPGANQHVLSVAATDSSDTLAYFSNYGSWVSVAAPGLNIYSTVPGSYQTMSGTSMATPLVAGEAAAIRSMFPSYSNADVFRVITTSVDPYLPYGTNTLSTGAGRVNVFKALGGTAAQSHPKSISFSMNPMWSGKAVTATVTLDAAAPATGQVVTLSSGSAYISVPATMSVAAGQTNGTFIVTTSGVSARTTGTITAQVGSTSASATLTLVPPVPSGITYNPFQVRGGTPVTATLTLNGAAPGGGLVVNLESQNSAVLTPDTATVTVQAGQSSANFTVTTYPVAAKTLGVIKATANGTSIYIGLNVFPAAPATITFSSNPVFGGTPVTATLKLTSPAPAGGLTVALASQDTTLATVPASVVVPTAQTTATFPVQTFGVTSQKMAVIVATANGSSIYFGLRLYPPVPYGIKYAPSTVKGGTGTMATLTISGVAPAGGLAVTLTAETPAVAQGPTTVTIPAGQSSANFAVSTSTVLANTMAVFGAAANGVTIHIGFTVTP